MIHADHEYLEWLLLAAMVILIVCAFTAWHDRHDQPHALTISGALAILGILVGLIWSATMAPIQLRTFDDFQRQFDEARAK